MFDFSVIIDVGVVALRILMPLYAIFIVYQLYAAMRRRRRPEKPLVTLMNTRTFDKIPTAVTLNEYIELAKNFSTAASGKFVNGILNNAVKQLRKDGVIFKS